jgi:Undecaprenyl-phosphate galactose phosphotransferase WbaP
MPQPEELRRSAATSALAMLSHFVLLVAAGEVASYRIVILLVWPLLVPVSYFTRAFTRALLIRQGRYCVATIVVGQGALAQAAIRELQGDPELGIVPVGVFDSTGAARTPAILGVPVFGPLEGLEHHAFPWPVHRALIALGPQDANREKLEWIATELTRRFPRVQVLSETSLHGNLWARPRPIGPYLAMEVRQARFSARQRRAKRAFDLIVSTPLLIAAAPIIGIAALAVKLASPGPAFFSQVREGEDGQPIRIHKLRSMVPDAQERLMEYLAANPAARFEYERTLKLRHDPRIIPRIGHLLRRSSIDELPQLWNIVRGDMSLVGPRIMPTREIELYSPAGQTLRRNVPPGLTGLWQVTARSNSDLKVREVADSFYVSNWSVWLDAWILLRTVRAVLAGSGAY